MSDVVFNESEFLARFPHLAIALNEGKLTQTYIIETYNGVAQWLGSTDSTSMYPYDPAQNIYTRKNLLYLATCHLLSLGLWSAGQPGRVASASQGSVSTSFDLLHTNSLVGQWWLQTPCGAQYWIQSAPYRKGGRIYIPSDYHPYG